MLSDWLAKQDRNPAIYKFPVVDVTELDTPNDEVRDSLALALLLAHGNPQQIRDQYNLLIEDAEDTTLDILKKYLEENVFPDREKMHGIARIGNFGEVLASHLLIEFEGFWFPIYKLRYREKKDWAMKLSDLCLIQHVPGMKPLICYGEVKTVSKKRNLDVAIDGHESLIIGEVKDSLSDPEILKFISTILYETHRLPEARFISQLLSGVVKYNKRYDLFIIHTSEIWTNEILERLDGHPLDPRLINFSTKVVLISQLGTFINETYDRCTTITKALTTSMDKKEYLEETFLNLNMLMQDRQFRRELAQVQASSIQEEHSSIKPDTHYTFQPKEIWRMCDYIFSNSSLLLREEGQIQEDLEKKQKLLDSLKIAAQSFEFLAKIADEEEKEILLINSAICYHMAGYQANAQCIAKMVEKRYLIGEGEKKANFSDHTIDLTLFFRQALLAFLRRDIAKLQRITQEILSPIRIIQERILVDAEEDNVILNIEYVYGHFFFQKALFDFTQYCIYGRLERFISAQRNIEKCHIYLQQIADTRLDVIASELRTLLIIFEERSMWSNIQKYGEKFIGNPIWNTYLRNLALEKSVVEFWPSQLNALQGGLLASDDSFVVQMPTSAGKTFIAELSLLATLTSSPQKRCLYIAPYRALVNEIEDRLAEMLGSLGYRVSNLNGGFEFDSFQTFLAVESHVLVTTPEKADLLFRTHPEYFENIATVVIDEGHMLDEGVPAKEDVDADKTLADALSQNGTLGRGISLEMFITRLKQKLPQIRFLFLSAVMPEINIDDFVTWLSKKGQKSLRIDKTERPSRQTIVTFTWSKVSSEEKGGYNGQLQYFNSDKTRTFVPYFIQRDSYYTGELTATGRRQKIKWPDTVKRPSSKGKHSVTLNKSQSTGMLAATFAKTGPVLVFCAMPLHVKQVIENIIKSLKYLEATEKSPNDHLKYVSNPVLESFDLAKEWLGEDHPLTRSLHYGVGLHYGPLPDPVRQAVEDDFRDGKISILVCTNTLGQGVNLPVKTAIIYSLERTYQDLENNRKLNTRKIKKRDFWNICGRAGRAGKETEGQIVFVTNSNNDTKLFKEYQNEQNIEVVESSLYKLLEALIEKRISQEELIEYFDAHVLALLAEEIVTIHDETAISDFLKSGLVGVQAQRKNFDLSPLISIITRTSSRIFEAVPDTALRTVFASTGLRVNSCITLENAVKSFLYARGEEISDDEMNNFYVDERLLAFAFEACQNIPEMVLAKSISSSKPEDELGLVKDWVGGNKIHELRSKYWTIDMEDAPGEYIADRVIYKLPWGLNAFIRILSFKLHKEYDELPLSWQYLPSMMKFGVNSVVACWIGGFGVSSRQLSLELASHYQLTDQTTFMSFIKWIVNLSNEFIFQDLSQGSIAEKKRFVRKISRIVADNDHLRFVTQKESILEATVQGISYDNRSEAAFEVKEGSILTLQAEPNNPYDSSAIMVLFEGKQIGYVQREKAKIISKDMQLGRRFQAYAKDIKLPVSNYPYPHIILTITG